MRDEDLIHIAQSRGWFEVTGCSHFAVWCDELWARDLILSLGKDTPSKVRELRIAMHQAEGKEAKDQVIEMAYHRYVHETGLTREGLRYLASHHIYSCSRKKSHLRFIGEQIWREGQTKLEGGQSAAA